MAAAQALSRVVLVRGPVTQVERAATSVRVPTATYRLQFRPGFGFREAARLVPFLHRVGISDIYASPLFQARAGSTHGYDVVDPSRLNPELGSEEEFEAFVAGLKRVGMGLILDIVPNHMAACHENPWWYDVLEQGRESAFAHYFDIRWDSEATGLDGKILLPVLGSPYFEVLTSGQLRLALDERGFSVRYYEHVFPVSLDCYRDLLAAQPESPAPARTRRAVAELLESIESPSATAAWKREARHQLWEMYRSDRPFKALVDANMRLMEGVPGSSRSFAGFDGLLSRQHYRLEYWRTGREKINYRRFFDINDLVALRVEEPDVFRATHELALRLVAEGKVTGLRIDHIDGLRDPAAYLERLKTSIAQRAGGGARPACYVLTEKILHEKEALQHSWPVSGSTGYDFLHASSAVFVDSARLERLRKTYSERTGITACFNQLVCEQKKYIVGHLFQSELDYLAAMLHKLGRQETTNHRHSRDELAKTIALVTAHLPVYRTYIRDSVSPVEASTLAEALRKATEEAPGTLLPALEFLGQVLLCRFPGSFSNKQKREALGFIAAWQQFTGPVMAKGMEDTACYLYNPLVSLNLVGGNSQPVSVQEFHAFNQARFENWPHSLNATSTHDTKRSEDVRARINVLSEAPDLWADCVARWMEWNRSLKQEVRGTPAPDANEELLIYQVLLGAWPLSPAEVDGFKERMRGFLVKAAREAKVHTNWLSPDAEYESALLLFLDRILDGGNANPFLPDFLRVVEEIAPHGAAGSLAQVLLKMACPGVPDFYQGTLLWDFSLVDPDNRRPVDFQRRIDALEELEWLDRCPPAERLHFLRDNWKDGKIKMYLIAKVLGFRRRHGDVFVQGEYIPVEAVGPDASHVLAFARRFGDDWVIAAVPRLTAQLQSGRDPLCPGRNWRGSMLRLPEDAPRRWRNVLTGEVTGGARLSDLFGQFPVALLHGALPSVAHSGGTDTKLMPEQLRLIKQL